MQVEKKYNNVGYNKAHNGNKSLRNNNMYRREVPANPTLAFVLLEQPKTLRSFALWLF